MITVKVEPIDRDIALLIDKTYSEKARSQYLAEFAIASVAEVKKNNQLILGSDIDFKTFVDGREGADEYSVKPTGRIVYEFQLIIETLTYIAEQLEIQSPVKTGRYQSSHTLFADGIEVRKGVNIPVAKEYTFVSTLPYARKIESGFSAQAPNGVYELTAHQAQQKFGNVAKIIYQEYTGVYGVTAETSSIKYGSVQKLYLNKSVNRFPSIQVNL